MGVSTLLSDQTGTTLQDALTQAMFWVDDSQIVAGETLKLYAGKTEKPCIEVKITKL